MCLRKKSLIEKNLWRKEELGRGLVSARRIDCMRHETVSCFQLYLIDKLQEFMNFSSKKFFSPIVFFPISFIIFIRWLGDTGLFRAFGVRKQEVF